MEYFNLEGNSRFPDFSQQGYIVERKLGNNFNGGRVTYQAFDLNTKQVVAIKQFQFAVDGNSWSDYEALECEIDILQQLNHPSIPKYINSFETASGFCLVQEYKNAPSLAQPRYFKLDRIRQIAISILEILIYLQHHIPPIIHRDIKPENILVDDKLNVYLVDFGLAKIDGHNSTSNSIVKGTLGFMPPEQMFCRPLSAASDLYGLGMTLICLLTGTPSSLIGKLIDDNHRVNVRSLLPNLNPRFINWLEKMVEPAPRDRYANADEAFVSLLNPKISDLSKTDTADTATVLKPIGLFMLPISLSLISSISHSFISRSKPQIQQLERENIDIDRIHRRIIIPPIPLQRKYNHVKYLDLRKRDLQKASFKEMQEIPRIKSQNLKSQELKSQNFHLRITELEDMDIPEDDLIEIITPYEPTDGE